MNDELMVPISLVRLLQEELKQVREKIATLEEESEELRGLWHHAASQIPPKNWEGYATQDLFKAVLEWYVIWAPRPVDPVRLQQAEQALHAAIKTWRASNSPGYFPRY